tara:strand:+ start:370 stop:732 length:363 start_codon:yes stop_codon:yes gene_type:complete
MEDKDTLFNDTPMDQMIKAWFKSKGWDNFTEEDIQGWRELASLIGQGAEPSMLEGENSPTSRKQNQAWYDFGLGGDVGDLDLDMLQYPQGSSDNMKVYDQTFFGPSRVRQSWPMGGIDDI